MSEFAILQQYFTGLGVERDDVLLGPGDDAAIMRLPPETDLVASIDTSVAGRHFLPDAPAHAIGYKAITVSVSDIVAMGATPAWLTLALTLPDIDSTWLKAFTAGVDCACQRYALSLVGGDLTQGPLTITSQVQGYLPQGRCLSRAGAKVGDSIYVTGKLGLAGLALAHLQGKCELAADELAAALEALYYPSIQPRLALDLLSVATACIDVSDGLAADLNHLLTASGVGAELALASLPIANELARYYPEQACYQRALSSGDDYCLCFTAPAQAMSGLAAQYQLLPIGTISQQPGCRWYLPSRELWQISLAGYQHFTE